MRRCCLLLTILLAVAPAAAQDGAPDPRVAELEALEAEARELQQRGELELVARRLERMAELEEQVFGDDSAQILGTRNWLAYVRERLGDFEAAKAQLVEALRIRKALSGPDHWETVRARLAIRDLALRAGLSSEERTRLQAALASVSRSFELRKNARFEESLEVAREAIRVLGEILGPDHRDTAAARNACALTLKSMGRLNEACEGYEQALASLEKALGAHDPSIASLTLNLSILERRRGNPDRALELALRTLESFERTFGAESAEAAVGLNSVGSAQEMKGEFQAARSCYERALRIMEMTLGSEHPRTVAARNNLAVLCAKMGDLERARELHRRCLEAREKTHGPEHPSTAQSLENLAGVLGKLARFEEAIPLMRRALAVREAALGAEHPETAATMAGLGSLYRMAGAYEKARPLLERAVAIQRRVLDSDDIRTARVAVKLGQLLAVMGDVAAALELEQEALVRIERLLGPMSPETGWVVANLAGLHENLGRLAEAKDLYERALAIARASAGGESPETAVLLNNLAALHDRMGDLDGAVALYEQALVVRARFLGPEHPDTAITVGNLGSLLNRMGRFERAGELLERSLSIRKQALGPDHPSTALAFNNLALQCQQLGESERAIRLFERARQIWTRSVGPAHPNTANMLVNLATLHGEEGRIATALPLARKALSVRRQVLEELAAFQSEQVQLRQFARMKQALDLFLSLAPADEAAETYDALLAAKGLVFGRQARLRALRTQPRLAGRFEQFAEVSRRLSGLLLADPVVAAAGDPTAEIPVLRSRLAELERELGKESRVFRRDRAAREVGVEEIRRRLPAGTTLIDFVAYRELLPRLDGKLGLSRHELRYAAFVLTAGAQVRRVDLGPAAPIDARIAAWRAAAAGGRPSKEGDALRKAIWDPIASHLGDATTILVSPDGALSRIPFAALPGEEPGTWLVDEYAFATVPVPRLLPALLESDAAPDGGSLLLVGEVDYGAPPGRPGGDLVASRAAPRTGLRGAWEPLAATRAEVLAVRDSFELRFEEGDTRSLRRKRATEESFREAAGAHRWIHVATHGFFAPEEVRSSAEAGAAVHPGVLSGIVLAGANLPVESGRDDGILTALEVASLDFSGTEMVVLSACETGLGEVAGGEGVLGLQRAFQMAGARSTVTSLWKVDDEFTRKLMTLFYEKLWDEGLPKAQALRQAQLALMADEGMRGLALKDESAGAPPVRLPPLYWAGFTLSGDWR